jgi:hypothetical protein
MNPDLATLFEQLSGLSQVLARNELRRKMQLEPSDKMQAEQATTISDAVPRRR